MISFPDLLSCQVANEFNLSEYEQKFLLTFDKGEALIIADQNHA